MSQNDVSFQAQNQEILDSAQLGALEQAFRDWVENRPAKSRFASRARMLLLFLLIRYTGAKLSEVLRLDLGRDIDLEEKTVVFRSESDGEVRKNVISERLASEVRTLISSMGEQKNLDIDPAYVRRTFYELAELSGFDKKSGGPEMLRKARAIELLRNVPLPAVQRVLGHSSPSQTTSLVAFSEEDLNEVARLYVERESGRKTSARNCFHGKVFCVKAGDVQTLVELRTPGGGSIYSLITNTSSERLRLAPGRLVTAEVKSPWLALERLDRPGVCSVENRMEGVLARVKTGTINTECVIALRDGTELCSVLTTQGFKQLQAVAGDPVRVLFGAQAVVLHAG